MSQGQILFLVMLILNTFAGYSFCHLLYLQFRQYRLGKPAWGGWTWRALTFIFAISYLFHLSGYLSFTFSDGKPGAAPLAVRVAWNLARPLMGPLLMQLFFITERSRLPRRWIWPAIIRTAWMVAVPVGLLWGLWVHSGADHGDYQDWIASGMTNSWRKDLDDLLRATSDVTLGVSVIFTAVVIWLSRRPGDSASRRRRHQWYLALISVELAALLLELVGWSPWLAASVHLLPLAFVLVTVYYSERLAFFDVFAKRGVLFFLALVVLTCYFAVVSPYLALHRLLSIESWINALTLVPLILATPWAYSKLSSWIDRAWLGRRFSAVGAVTSFSESVQGAINEQDLLERAESSLSYIFQSKACIDPCESGAEMGELRTPVRINGADWGVVSILPRPDEVPFLSQDAELLRVLAHSLGSMLESQRLRDQSLAHKQREQELALSATQSELKALRAQINPHFLFNALNTIAALIPQKPDKAEQTVEQLAEVFRYTVRRSARECVRLAEEIDFVRSYLEIEQARFGERLRVRIDVEGATENIQIPAMIIQTLAENAIKHGITCVRGLGLIAISARLNGDRALVSVENNGPGFERTPRFDSPPESANGGYGLRNVQERLRAYYGANARLQFERDADAATTIVSFEIPMIEDFGRGARPQK